MSYAPYLEKYAEAGTLEFKWPDGRWHTACVVPIYGEAALLEGCLNSLSAAAQHSQKRVLLIAVVNARESSPQSVKDDNRRSLELLRSRPFPGLTLVVLDKTLPEKQGVGLARKLGCDLALAALHQGRVQQTYLHTTDADCRVDEDYFEIETSLGQRAGLGQGVPGAILHPYFHALDWDRPQAALALSLYDAYLHYFVEGLRYAGSPYAFHTLGSTICFHANAYAAVRGFPRREAAEDFYFLSKIAQVGIVAHATKAAIVIQQRDSDRVPFGTGRAMADIATLDLPAGYRVYQPRSFTLLQHLLGSLRLFAENRQLLMTTSYWKAHGLEAVTTHLGAALALEQALSHRKDPVSLLRHCLTWFDALKTVQFFNFLAANGLPNMPLLEALKESPFPSKQPLLHRPQKSIPGVIRRRKL